MHNAIKQYITKIETEIDRCYMWLEEHIESPACIVSKVEGRIEALLDVKADLKEIVESVQYS